MQMPGFNLVGGGFPNDTIPFSFPNAGNYKLIAEIVDASHVKIAGTASKTAEFTICLLYTSPSPRDRQKSRMPSSA